MIGSPSRSETLAGNDGRFAKLRGAREMMPLEG